VIITNTSAGVRLSFPPPRWLTPGDEMAARSKGLDGSTTPMQRSKGCPRTAKGLEELAVPTCRGTPGPTDAHRPAMQWKPVSDLGRRAGWTRTVRRPRGEVSRVSLIGRLFGAGSREDDARLIRCQPFEILRERLQSVGVYSSALWTPFRDQVGLTSRTSPSRPRYPRRGRASASTPCRHDRVATCMNGVW